MSAITAHLGFTSPAVDGESAERRRIARLIGVGSASFTFLIAAVAALIALAA